ncbi:MAG: ABC transporter ATP-binding protein/permease [Bdellovibrionales bacterium]|nr:ABC transporter ATP-binding protein/permease [Bdellovibrionales bacterium]
MNTSKNKWYKLFFFDGSKFMLGLVLVCLIIAAALGVMTPKLIANLSANYSNNNLFQEAIVALLINFVAVYVNRVIYQLAVNKYVRLLIQYARTQTYGRWLSSNEHDSEKYPQGEILSRIMSDTEAIRDLITSGSFGIFIDLCFVASCLVGFITLNKFTGFFISGTELLATLGLIWGSQLMRDIFMRLRNSQAKVNRVTANVLGGFHQMYYTRHDNYASVKSNEAFEDFLQKQNQANNMDAAYYAVAESLYPILLALVIFVFPYSGLTEAALIFAIVDLIQRSINPIKEISGKIANIQRAITGIDRIQHFLNDMPLKLSVGTDQLLSDEYHSKLVKFDVHVNKFTYPVRASTVESGGVQERDFFSLEDIHFEGRPGELIGIVGLSGSGKSTLLSILAGNLIAPDAEVELSMKSKEGDYKLSIKDLDEYRREVSIVSQESHIFSETLLFNITLKRDLVTSEIAHFEAEWKKLEESIPYLKTMGLKINEKITPAKLSLGQKQLLAGVRACYLKKNIVFFDEISSALDSELEHALRKCILLIQEFSLTIIVAHRVETIIGADKIIVMDKGRVNNLGTHKELLLTSQVYQEFIRELSHS